MNSYDVEAHVEFEIEQLKEDIAKLRRAAVGQEKFYEHALDIMEAYDRLIDTLELRIQQLKDKQTEPTT